MIDEAKNFFGNRARVKPKNFFEDSVEDSWGEEESK